MRLLLVAVLFAAAAADLYSQPQPIRVLAMDATGHVDWVPLPIPPPGTAGPQGEPGRPGHDAVFSPGIRISDVLTWDGQNWIPAPSPVVPFWSRAIRQDDGSYLCPSQPGVNRWSVRVYVNGLRQADDDYGYPPPVSSLGLVLVPVPDGPWPADAKVICDYIVQR